MCKHIVNAINVIFWHWYVIATRGLPWDLITHSCSTFNGRSVKPPLNLYLHESFIVIGDDVFPVVLRWRYLIVISICQEAFEMTDDRNCRIAILMNNVLCLENVDILSESISSCQRGFECEDGNISEYPLECNYLYMLRHLLVQHKILWDLITYPYAYLSRLHWIYPGAPLKINLALYFLGPIYTLQQN